MNLILNNGQKLWFTSDTHFNHSNICKSTTKWANAESNNLRDFNSLNEMNDRLITGINSNVAADDILFHLGDWSFGGFESIKNFRNKLNCKNIHLLLGNHDHHIENNIENIRDCFSSVNHILNLTVTHFDNECEIKTKFVLMHYPIASWNNLGHGVIHLHGHVHLKSINRIGIGKVMDVGVDGNDLNPINMIDVIHLMNKQPIASMLYNDYHSIVENYK